MKPYISIFLTYHKKEKGEFMPCAICGAASVNIHHISGRPMGNKSKRYDVPENLIPLCMEDHNDCHSEIITKQKCKFALYEWAEKYGTPIDFNKIMNFK